ncbi:MAG: hypothetical protein LBN71_01720 [Tannerella sp.]|nr:hypothetical protein [Tannerella sp.]
MRKYILTGFACILCLNVFSQNRKENSHALPPQKDTTAFKQDLKGSAPAIPIITDFSEYIQYTDIDSLDSLDLDSLDNNRIDLTTMPKAVFILYINSLCSQTAEGPKVQYDLLHKGEIRRPVPTGVGFSAADMLELLFSKTARAKLHNRKHANAWKTYNQY